MASIAAAAGALLYAWQLSRDAKARSDARVAALGADIDREGVPEEMPAPALAFEPTSTATGSLFVQTEGTPGPVKRLAPALLAGVLLLAGVAVTTALVGGNGGTAAAEANVTRQQPLELLSLRHRIAEGTVTVTGLVRNPAANGPLERLAAVVYLFDAKGGFLGSGRAPLEFPKIGPGEESPFVVSVDAPAGVARYRVSFRHSDQGVVSHVDRREVVP
jgi:hypothetical protein